MVPFRAELEMPLDKAVPTSSGQSDRPVWRSQERSGLHIASQEF